MRLRTTIWLGFFLLVVAGVAGVSIWMLLKRDRQTVVFDIPASYLETVDTSRFSVLPFRINRFSPDDSVMVRFPKGAVQYGLYMYDAGSYKRYLLGDRTVAPMSQNDLAAKLLGRPQLNLSRLPDGTYYAHLTQCNFQGFFSLELNTIAPPPADSAPQQSK